MQGKHIETLYGKYSKYEITKKDGILTSSSFLIYRDGSFWKSRKTLSEAVELCR